MIVEVGEVVQGSQIASDAWISSHPRAAYTTARTTGGGQSILKLTAHINRLAESARLMHLADDASADALRDPVLRILRKAIQRTTSQDLKLTLLLYHRSGTAALTLDCHAQSLPPPPVPPVAVQLGGSPRANAAAKDSVWVDTRATLVQAQQPSVHETALVGDDGRVYEGLSSNVFAILDDGTVYTADDGVLHGTIRTMALAACAQLDIPVVLQPPTRPGEGSGVCWQGAFLTSTSRLVLPIDQLIDEHGNCLAAFSYPEDGIVKRLAAAVAASVISCSEPVFDDDDDHNKSQ